MSVQDYRLQVAKAALRAWEMYDQSYDLQKHRHVKNYLDCVCEAMQELRLDKDNTFDFWVVYQMSQGAEPTEACTQIIEDVKGE